MGMELVGQPSIPGDNDLLANILRKFVTDGDYWSTGSGPGSRVDNGAVGMSIDSTVELTPDELSALLRFTGGRMASYD